MADDENIPLIDELGVKDLSRQIFVGHGRLLSAAGRDSPIAEVTDECLILYPPDKPFEEKGKNEEIVIKTSNRGILLNELGEERKVPACWYDGCELWVLAEQKPGTSKFYVAWFDEDGNAYKLTMRNDQMTADQVFRLRNRTHNGELTIFEDITTEGDTKKGIKFKRREESHEKDDEKEKD